MHLDLLVLLCRAPAPRRPGRGFARRPTRHGPFQGFHDQTSACQELDILRRKTLEGLSRFATTRSTSHLLLKLWGPQAVMLRCGAAKTSMQSLISDNLGHSCPAQCIPSNIERLTKHTDPVPSAVLESQAGARPALHGGTRRVDSCNGEAGGTRQGLLSRLNERLHCSMSNAGKLFTEHALRFHLGIPVVASRVALAICCPFNAVITERLRRVPAGLSDQG